MPPPAAIAMTEWETCQVLATLYGSEWAGFTVRPVEAKGTVPKLESSARNSVDTNRDWLGKEKTLYEIIALIGHHGRN